MKCKLLHPRHLYTVEGKSYQVASLELLPNTLSGRNLCPDSTPGCRASCYMIPTAENCEDLETREMTAAEEAPSERTHFFFENPKQFRRQLEGEIEEFVEDRKLRGIIPAIRLNGLSDLSWENVRNYAHRNLMECYPLVQFVDYTKVPHRMDRFLQRDFPHNYYLLFSRSEVNEPACLDFLARGGNVAVVFNIPLGEHTKKVLPSTWHGYPVLDGDVADIRFIDPPGHVVGLRLFHYLYDTHEDTTGFVVPVS